MPRMARAGLSVLVSTWGLLGPSTLSVPGSRLHVVPRRNWWHTDIGKPYFRLAVAFEDHRSAVQHEEGSDKTLEQLFGLRCREEAGQDGNRGND